MELAVYAYGLAALAFAVLATLVATGWTRVGLGRELFLASLVTSFWALLLAYHANTQAVPSIVLFGAEILRMASWLVFLLRQLRGPEGHALNRRYVVAVHLLWIGSLLAGLILAGSGRLIGEDLAPHALVALAPMLLALTGIVLVEQLYRNVTEQFRWSAKYFCLGLGGVFVFDLLMYSNALLFRQVSISIWSARGVVMALIVPLLMIAARRHPGWAVQMFISRKVVFYSGALTLVGIYLVAMALGGYYIRLFGGTWASFAQAVLGFAAALALLIVLSSGQARRRIKVFLLKHFYKNKYEYRDEWLRLIETLDSTDSGHPLQERVLMALCRMVGSSGGLLWLRREDEFVALAGWHMKLPEAVAEPQDSAFSRFLADRGWIFDSEEYNRDPGHYGRLELPDWLQERDIDAIVVPLMRASDLVGFVVLNRPDADFHLTYEDIDLLRTVGRQVASYLMQEAATQDLAESRQFEAYNRLTSFIMHDLKNLIAQQRLVVQNAGAHRNNPEFFDDTIETISNSVRRMENLLQQLQRGATESSRSRVDLNRLIGDVAKLASDRQPAPIFHPTGKPVYLISDRQRLANVLTHVVRNAQDACDAGGRIEIRLERENGIALVQVADNGTGMSAEFIRERLFKPFDSTKGTQGMGIGAYQAREFVRSAGGDVTVVSTPGQGTIFSISLPVLAADYAPELQGVGHD